MTTEINFKTGTSYVDWATVFAGAVVAVAISFVLLQFASAVGVANMEALRDNVMELTRERLIIAGVIVLLIQVLSSLLGGYVAGRLRAPVGGVSLHESEVRDGLHGLLVWATSTIAVVVAAFIASSVAAMASAEVDTSVVTESPQAALDREQAVAIVLAFAAGATSLISAVAAWFAATKGGDHRDKAVDYSRHLSFRR